MLLLLLFGRGSGRSFAAMMSIVILSIVMQIAAMLWILTIRVQIRVFQTCIVARNSQCWCKHVIVIDVDIDISAITATTVLAVGLVIDATVALRLMIRIKTTLVGFEKQHNGHQ